MSKLDLDRAARELGMLRRVASERLAVALGASLVAGSVAVFDPSLAVAFGAGALFLGFLAVASTVRRRARIAALAVHSEAYALPEIRRYGEALATMEKRRALARAIAGLLRDARGPGAGVELVDRVASQAPSLAAIGRALTEPGITVAPTALASCVQLLTDGVVSPLLNPDVPRVELARTIGRIEAGISSGGTRSFDTTRRRSELHRPA